MLNASALNEQDISAESAVVISQQTGEVVFEKNAHKTLSMASTTKILTSLIAIESGKLQNEVTVTSEMVKTEGTSMGLLPGDQVSLDELVHGMLLQSGNDAANSVAIYLSGSLASFAESMNNRAQKIGMLNSSFVTPSGLDSKEHYSTAYDMALLGREAVSNCKFLSVCSKQSETLTYGNPPYRRTLYNHNKLLDYYDYALGIKTGFTKKSGRCLVSYADKEGVGLIAVTLNAPNDWNDHKLLFDYGFEKLDKEIHTPKLPETICVVGSEKDNLIIKSDSIAFSSLKEVDTQYKVYLDQFVYAPVNIGDVVGKWELYADNVLIDSKPIYAGEDAL